MIFQEKGNKVLASKLVKAQRDEITEHCVYKRLARVEKDENNRKVLEEIAADEKKHYEFWLKVTGKPVRADRVRLFFYTLLARILGVTFAVKLMESGENSAQEFYSALKGVVPGIDDIISDEQGHEADLISLIDEERLRYASSVVLGLNDALVELTGALVGLTLALQNSRLIAIVGLITGVAASMSMAASEYLSTKQESTVKDPLKASIYTGGAYILTVILLIFPYLVFSNIFICLLCVALGAVFVISSFTYYISVAKGLSFKKKFLEMAVLSFSIAGINFFIGLLIRKVFNLDVS